jgi:dual specificity protein kinase YAK1
METLSQHSGNTRASSSEQQRQQRRNLPRNGSQTQPPTSSSSSAGSTVPPGVPQPASVASSRQQVDDAVRRLGYRLSIQAHGEPVGTTSSSGSSSHTIMAGSLQSSRLSQPTASQFQHIAESGFRPFFVPSRSSMGAIDETAVTSAGEPHQRTSKVARWESYQGDKPSPSAKRESSMSLLRKLTLECKDRFQQWGNEELLLRQQQRRQPPSMPANPRVTLSPHRHAFAQMGLTEEAPPAAQAHPAQQPPPLPWNPPHQHHHHHHNALHLPPPYSSGNSTTNNRGGPGTDLVASVQPGTTTKGLLSAVLEGHSDSATSASASEYKHRIAQAQHQHHTQQPQGDQTSLGSQSISTKDSKTMASSVGGGAHTNAPVGVPLRTLPGPAPSTSPQQPKFFPRGKCLTHPSEPVSNNGHDNIDGNFIAFENDIISVSRKNMRTIQRKKADATTTTKLRSADYRIVSAAGQGTFAQVFQCWHLQSSQHVALKIVKNKPAYTRQAAIEIDIFQALQEEEPANAGAASSAKRGDYMVNLISYFMHENHLCLVFELLGLNLYEVLKRRQFRGLPLTVVRDIIKQSVEGIRDLSRKNVVHCDLKPENILFVSTDVMHHLGGDKTRRTEEAPTSEAVVSISPDISNSNCKIKLIDFGSACFEGYTAHTYIQSRFYRCPEVLLGLPYDSAIDMWSLGCVAAELFVGLPVLPGVHEHDQVVRIAEMIAKIPDWMLDQGAKSSKYYVKFVVRGPPGGSAEATRPDPRTPSPAPSLPQWRLKTQQEYIDSLTQSEIGKKGGMDKMKKQPGNRYFKRTKLSDILILHGQSSTGADKELVPAFVHFLYGILDPDPWKRLTAFQAAQHPFITGEFHLLRTKTEEMELNPKEENQANLELEWYWPSPWDPAVCRRKLLNVQKIREKQQAARRSMLGRQHGSGNFKPPALQQPQRPNLGAVPDDPMMGPEPPEGANRSSSPPNQISSSDSTNASQQIFFANPVERVAERPLASSSWNAQGQSSAQSNLLANSAALPHANMFAGPQSFHSVGLTPTQADLAMALERPGVVPGTYGLGSSASQSTSTSQTRSTPSDNQFLQFSSYQMPPSAYGSMNDSIGSLGYDQMQSIPTTPTSMMRNPQFDSGRSYLPNAPGQMPMASMNVGPSAVNPPYIDAQQFAFFQQQQQMAMIQQQQQLGIFPPAMQPQQPTQFVVPQQQPIMLANAPNGGFYYVMTSPTGQPIILQPVGTLNQPDMYQQGYAAGMNPMGAVNMNPQMGQPYAFMPPQQPGMAGLQQPRNPNAYFEPGMPPHMGQGPPPPQQQPNVSRSSRNAPRHPRRSGTSM